MNFKYLGNCDISEIKNKIQNLPENVWDEYIFRQKQYDAHKDTKSINVKFSQESSEFGIEADETKYYKLLGFNKFLNSIVNLYKLEYGDGYFQRILIVNLPKFKNIEMHYDVGYGLIICKRTHIPIVTNDEILFQIENETKNLKEGEIWEIDNQKSHAVYNQTNVDRIHLILDYMPTKNNKTIKSLI